MTGIVAPRHHSPSVPASLPYAACPEELADGHIDAQPGTAVACAAAAFVVVESGGAVAGVAV